MGPAMLRLNEKQRLFVCALAVFGGDQTRAYAYAGYSSINPRSVNASASRLANAENIVQAIREESLRRINSATLLAVSTLVELAAATNPDKKLRRQCAVDILDRTNFNPVTEHRIVIKDDRTTEELIASIKQLALAGGLDSKALLAPIIDTTYEEVEIDPDLADLF